MVTMKNAYPLPLIPDILNKSLKPRLSISLSWTFAGDTTTFGSKKEQVEGHLSDERGPFRTSVMFFGLTNSPATFQMMMNNIFKELIDEGVVTIYMDGILIFGSQTREQHHEL